MPDRPGQRAPEPHTPLARWVGLPIGLQVAFLATGTLALGLLVDALVGGESTLALWLPGGIVVVALLLSPSRRWPALIVGMLAGALVFSVLDGNGPAITAGLLVAAAVQAVVCAVVTRALLGGPKAPDLGLLRDARALLVGAVAGSSAGGVIGAATLVLAGDAAFGRSWVVLTMAAVTGVLVVAPLAFAFPGDGSRPALARRPLEAGASVALAAIVPAAALWSSDLPLGWLAAAVPVWAALRLGPLGAMATTSVTAVVITALTVRGHGYFVTFSDSPGEALVLAQALGAVIVVLSALLAAVTAERARDAVRLARAERMESMGRLAGAVAHDFNNILTVIGGHGSLALEKAERGEDVTAELRRMLAASDQAAELTNRMLPFSRHRDARPDPVALNGIVRSLDRKLRRTVGAGITVDLALDPEAGHVACDATRLEQVLLDLAVNARDAMRRGGRLRVRTQRLDDHWTRLSVADTGTGMDEATRAKAFDPFFTTKDRGTGLGLATAWGVAEQCGGHLDLRSTPGAGTTVRLDLPRAEPPAAAPPAPAPLRRGATETVLVAEDEPSVRLLVRIALSGQGYTLLEAADGQDALEVAERHDGRIDLLLTDIVMPRVSGPELAARLGLPVLYMSGYAEPDVTPIAELDAENFIAKPFSPPELARRVRERLDQPAPHRGAATATPRLRPS